MSRSRISDFEILARLGSGSFGTVYKVRRVIDDSLYVIKNVRIVELSFKEQSEAINEVQILSQLKSPYVVRYYDSFIEKDSLHIVMEFCNRGDLQNLLKKAKEKNVACLKESVIWSIGLQIILGLHYLHRKKILHRDLKTANVFLSKDESRSNYLVKIGDLGVAKLMDTSTAFANTIVGTPYYLSPELCADKPYRDKSDCWALGVLIYECCTLEHPFEARNQCALIMKIISSPVKPPSSSHVTHELINLCMGLLQKDPEQRPSTRDIFCEVSRLRHHHYHYRYSVLMRYVRCACHFYYNEVGN
jgi:NIMA (never in mitosis gene a)-related kinase